MEPRFEFSDTYYFDVQNKRIYGREKYTQKYFHELSHYKDHQSEWYTNTELMFSMSSQFSRMVAALLIPGLVIIGNYENFVMLAIFYFIFNVPHMFWTIQEEIRADTNGLIWRMKYLKGELT